MRGLLTTLPRNLRPPARLGALLIVALLASGGCRKEPAASGATPGDASRGNAQAVQAQLELELAVRWWEVRGDGVGLHLAATPRLRHEGKDSFVGSGTVLRAGETVALIDHHIHDTFTLRAFDEDRLEFDYTYRHRPPSGEVETGSGRFVMTRALNPAWRSCSNTRPCVAIHTYCGGTTAVAADAQQLAEAFYGKIGAVKRCSGKTLELPNASCVDGTCQPGPRFP